LVLPSLNKIRLITNEEPYMPMRLFGRLQKLQIDMELVQFQVEDKWPLLEELVLRGSIVAGPLFEAFLNRHEHSKCLHISVVSSLRPLGPLPGWMHELLRHTLNTVLSIEVVDSIMNHATEHASGHERPLCQHIYARLGKITNEKTGKDVRQSMTETFEQFVELESERLEMKRLFIQSNIAKQLKASCSTEVFWKDGLAIKGAALMNESKDGLWINDEMKDNLSIPRASRGVSLEGWITM
jgi:hypothetical protein